MSAAALAIRLFILLRREGELFEVNRIYRLCREAGLTIRKPRARRRTEREQRSLIETRPNARWSPDFVHDQFAPGGVSGCRASSMT